MLSGTNIGEEIKNRFIENKEGKNAVTWEYKFYIAEKQI